ncbi:ester cyclase [Halorubellus litoreus]|uniref:Ester cyclase n=1 Tax=Halorubellus litoreus TaxID=755308 RepID=A0ABD5VE90_9EURY
MATKTGQESNERIARRYPEEVVTKGDIDLIDELCTVDVLDHSPLGELQGHQELKNQIEMLRGGFSDFSASVDEVIAEGDLVAMRVTLRGTHDGEFMGTEATGKSFEVPNMIFTRVENGQIAERWVVPDMFGMLTQIGVVERPTA